jgi:hypothetical protein
MQRIAITLQQYAGYLLVTGLASAFYNAADKTFGWNDKGKSGLIALGAFAVLAFIFGVIAAEGKKWAGWAGLVLSFFLLCFGGSKAFSTGRAISAGDKPEYLWFQVILFAVTMVFSIFTFIKLGTALRRSPQA